jgi:thioredoxin reductase (NADPH)
MKRDLIIIGSGAAGWTAAIYAKRGGLNPLVITGLDVGGQLTTTTIVENYSGFPNGIDGNELMCNMYQQALNQGVETEINNVIAVDFTQYPYVIETDSNKYECESVIIATGAKHKYLGINGETEFMNNGVHYCATCDGFFYKNKSVAVIGGGDTACEEALYLSNIAKDVTILVRGNEMKASNAMQEKIIATDNITVVYGWETECIKGGLNNQVILCAKEEKTFDGVFVAIGVTPNTDLFKNKLKLDNDNYLVVNSNATNKVGIFACGDVIDKKYKQAIVAAGSGCMAAMECINYLKGV